MKPIEIKISGHSPRPPRELCVELLELERWPEFKGYAFLPGVESARFEIKTPQILGSRIQVRNTDGSSHVEEIIEWDVDNKVAIRFQEFDPPLQHLASHFIETWNFEDSTHGTQITRTMSMYPKGWTGWILLLPISRLMKKAFERNREQLS